MMSEQVQPHATTSMSARHSQHLGVPENLRILIVDDNESIHKDFRKILGPDTNGTSGLDALDAELFGDEPAAPTKTFSIDSAFQGDQALTKVSEALERGTPYAVVFMDVRMPPGMDGVEATTELLKLDPLLSVVICSAYSDHGPDELAAAFGHTDRVLILKKPFDTVEVRQLANALQTRWVLARAASMKLDDLSDLVERRTCELQDANTKLKEEATARERMEVELRLAQKLEAVGQLAAGIAHEINTPMQYVGDNLHFLKSAFDDFLTLMDTYQTMKEHLSQSPEGKTLLAQIAEAEEDADVTYLREHVPTAFIRTFEGVERVSEIVRSMKEFSHPDQRERAQADINKILTNALTVACNEYKYVADIEQHLGELPDVLCHAGDIGQVFLNLIVNAAHAIADGLEPGTKGKITVTTRAVNDATVRIEVRDTGGGIPDEIRDRIFDPFFTTKEVGKGTGQGLAIARTVVDKHGGTMTVESEVGVGTLFTIDLPVAGKSDEEEAP